jgi:hypothetical protein
MKTRLRSFASALAPPPTPRGPPTSTPRYLRGETRTYTRAYGHYTIAVTPYCDALAGVAIRRELTRVAGLVAKSRALGMDCMRLAVAMFLADPRGWEVAARVPNFATKNAARDLFVTACLGTADPAAVPKPSEFYVLAAREALLRANPNPPAAYAARGALSNIFNELSARYFGTV